MLNSVSLISVTNTTQKRSLICQKFVKMSLVLAWTVLCYLCANLIEFLKKILTSPAFSEQFRKNSAHFTRNRKLPFISVFLYLCNFFKSSYQAELNKFFKVLSGSMVATKVVSKAAFCKARQKLKYEAFTTLNNHAVDHFNENFAPQTWHGFFLRAVDGSTVKLPDFPEIAEHFGAWHPRQGDPVPMARVSEMFDPLNRITILAFIAPKDQGEREMAAAHFQHLSNRDLILLDRGYPAFWLFKLILTHDANFCARVSTNKWKVVRKFMTSGKAEKLIHLNAPTSSIAACREHSLDTRPMLLRFIRVELDTGETEVLITSLTDSAQYPHFLFADLYHERWPVEEDYKVVKCRMEMENFSGKSALSVYQDFHARVFSKNITAMLTFATQQTIDKPSEPGRHSYRINFTQALSTMRDAIVLLFQKTARAVDAIIQDLLTTFAQALEPVRPGRKYPRNHKRSQRKCCLNYKPTL